MFQFLCLFGPGVLAWLVKSHCCQKEQDSQLIVVLAEMVSYSLVTLAAVMSVLKPLGRIHLVLLSNGQLDVQYGASAILASVCFALVLGLFSGWAAKKY